MNYVATSSRKDLLGDSTAYRYEAAAPDLHSHTDGYMVEVNRAVFTPGIPLTTASMDKKIAQELVPRNRSVMAPRQLSSIVVIGGAAER